MSTLSRYEVWESDTGESARWKPARGGVFESREAAINFARDRRWFCQSVTVERWNAGTNTFINTEYEA